MAVSQTWYHRPGIPAAWEVYEGGWQVLHKLQSKFEVSLHNLMRICFKIKVKGGWRCVSVVERMCGMPEALTWVFSMEGRAKGERAHATKA